MACSVVCEAVVSTAMPENDMHLRDYCVICFNSTRDYMSHSPDIARKRTRQMARIMRTERSGGE